MRKSDWQQYLKWAVQAFRISASGIRDETQIHSPRVPSKAEMVQLLHKAQAVIPADQLWVNPDCGLKTRHWDEIKKALTEMVDAAKELRLSVKEPVSL